MTDETHTTETGPTPPDEGKAETKATSKRKRSFSAAFWAKAHAIFDAFGDEQYDKLDMVAPMENLLRDEVKLDTLYSELAVDVVDRLFDGQKSSHGQPELFSYDEHVALGENQRIKRGRMNLDQMDRWKDIQDDNKIQVDKAWAASTEWYMARKKLMRERGPDTLVEDVMTEDGTVIPAKTH